MKTILRSKGKEVEISTEGPVVIIGECINPTRRKKLISSLHDGDFGYVCELARQQIDAFADVLDVNVGYPGVDDIILLPETIKQLQSQFDIPLCIDSPNPKAIEAALKIIEGKCLINSVSGEEKSINCLLPIVKEYDAAIIGLTLDDDGISLDPYKRLAIAEKILNRAIQMGINEEDIIIDPLAMAVSAEPQACLVTLQAIQLIHEKLGLNITQGASNISFGLPNREVLNIVHMVLSIRNGLSCAIANPEKIVAAVRATDLVLGRDEFALRFIEYSQSIKQ